MYRLWLWLQRREKGWDSDDRTITPINHLDRRAGVARRFWRCCAIGCSPVNARTANLPHREILVSA
jgi:hypothetical protein